MIIGVILPSLSNIVFPEVLRGIHAGLEGTQYQPMIGVTEYDLHKEQQLIASLLAWQPAAIITTGFDHTDSARRMLVGSGIRVGELMDIDGKPVDIAVGLSHRAAGRAMARRLLDRGYRRIGYVGHDCAVDRRAYARYEGLREALHAAGLDLAAQEFSAQPSSTMTGRDALSRLLSRSTGIEAVAFSNDDMAVGGFMHCLAAEILVPGQLALIGFNGLEIGQSLPKPLSTIFSNRFAIGRTAVEKLLETPGRSPTATIIDTGFSLIEGATT